MDDGLAVNPCLFIDDATKRKLFKEMHLLLYPRPIF